MRDEPEKQNAFLVGPIMGLMDRIELYLTSNQWSLNYQIYVPKMFILGNFNEGSLGFKLSPTKIIYIDSPKELAIYQDRIEKHKLKIEQSLFLSESALEVLEKYGKAHVQTREKISTALENQNFFG